MVTLRHVLVSATLLGGLLSGCGSSDVSFSEVVPLQNYRVIDAEYSAALDRIVASSVEPSALLLIDPDTGDAAAIPLDIAPGAVSLSVDGRSAAVGHDGAVSLVNLERRAVDQILEVTAPVADVLYVSGNLVLAFPPDRNLGVRALDPESGAEQSPWRLFYFDDRFRVHPSGTKLYGHTRGEGVSDVVRYNVVGGAAEFAYDGPFHGEREFCGDLWLSTTGDQIFTRCGDVVRTSDNEAEDMTYQGSLEVGLITHLAHSLSREEVALLGEAMPERGPLLDDFGPPPLGETRRGGTELYVYDANSFDALQTVALPRVRVGATDVPGYGRFVFARPNDRGYVVVVEPALDSAPDGRVAIAASE